VHADIGHVVLETEDAGPADGVGGQVGKKVGGVGVGRRRGCRGSGGMVGGVVWRGRPGVGEVSR